MLEVARNVVAGREYAVVPADVGDAGPKVFFRLSRAIDEAVDRTRMSDATTHPGWRVLKIERGRVPEVVWPNPSGEDGDGEESMIPRRPRRPAGSGAIALPLP